MFLEFYYRHYTEGKLLAAFGIMNFEMDFLVKFVHNFVLLYNIFILGHFLTGMIITIVKSTILIIALTIVITSLFELTILDSLWQQTAK